MVGHPHRRTGAGLLPSFLLLLGSLGAGQAAPIAVAIPMRDGVDLPALIYLPEGTGPWPTVLERTPYGLIDFDDYALQFTQFNLAYVVQDTRSGVFGQGQYFPFLDDGWGENQDGFDTVAWVASQEWCNGDVSLDGRSASAITSFLALGSLPPALRSVRCTVGASDLHRDVAFRGGVLRREVVQGYLRATDNLESSGEIMAHARRTEFWDPMSLSQRCADIQVPSLQVTGWFDVFCDSAVETARSLNTQGGEGARGRQIAIIGPWTHTGIGEQVQGELVFPPSALMPAELESLANGFLSETLRRQALGVFGTPNYHYYLMGDVDDPSAPGNLWLESEVWPPPGGTRTLYLHGGGLLSAAPPAGGAASTSYVSDPKSPVPTQGGQNLVIPSGPHDQSATEARPDVITFTTPPLPEPVIVAGRVECVLHVSSTAPDADFFVKLCDVYPDGRSMLLTEGALQARRRLGLDREDFMIPGEVCELAFPIGNTAIAFARGHRVRVSIASTNWPRFEINPQTGATPRIDDPVSAVATHTIHHSVAHPSRVIFPVPEAAAAEAGLFYR